MILYIATLAIPAMPFWIPAVVSFLMTIIFAITFYKTDVMRRHRIRYTIFRNRLGRHIKHFAHDLIYIIRISALVRLLIYFMLLIGIVLFITLTFYILYNQFLVNIISPYIGLKPFKLSASSVMGTIFSRQTNPIYAVGFLFGMALSAFMRPKIEKFVEKVKTKKSMIYVFGSNEVTRMFVKTLCDFGFGPLVALIAEKEKPWMDSFRASIDLLPLDDPDILRDPTIYSRIGFHNALNILILVDDRELAQHILLNIKKVNPDVDVILLSRNKPPILDIVGDFLTGIRIIDDIEITYRELIRQISIGFRHANAVETPVPKEYIGRTPSDLETDFNQRLKVLGVKRGERIVMPERFTDKDIIIIYLLNPKALQEFLQLLPISPFEKIAPLTVESGGESEKKEGE